MSSKDGIPNVSEVCKVCSAIGLGKSGIETASAASCATRKGVKVNGGNDVRMDSAHYLMKSVSMPSLEYGFLSIE